MSHPARDLRSGIDSKANAASGRYAVGCAVPGASEAAA